MGRTARGGGAAGGKGSLARNAKVWLDRSGCGVVFCADLTVMSRSVGDLVFRTGVNGRTVLRLSRALEPTQRQGKHVPVCAHDISHHGVAAQPDAVFFDAVNIQTVDGFDRCTPCKGWFHARCMGLSIEEEQRLVKESKSVFVCTGTDIFLTAVDAAASLC